MIKLLIGGSPCTFWSIAQKNGRETEASGMGWELFKNYLIAKEKFKPDFFLYENNKSAAQPIKDQISRELGVDLMHINSALVSAQNRQRFYAFNWKVEQPEDRGILLQSILEDGLCWRDKAYTIDSNYWKTSGQYSPERQSTRRAQVAVGVGYRNRRENDGKLYRRFETSGVEKSNTLTTVQTDSMVAQAICYRGRRTKDGEYFVNYEARTDGKANALVGNYTKSLVVEPAVGGKPVYEVINGEIEIKGKKYPIKLPDGFYIIRKFTPTECERLQTLPDGYTAGVSDTQRYKALGNGWTAEVIIHILNGALANIPKDEEIVVLSMYDGIATGRHCLARMGFTNVKYFAYEIDKYAKQMAMKNYPDIIQLGDAFDLRKPDWAITHLFDERM